jgi:hypothetical protein
MAAAPTAPRALTRHPRAQLTLKEPNIAVDSNGRIGAQHHPSLSPIRPRAFALPCILRALPSVLTRRLWQAPGR